MSKTEQIIELWSRGLTNYEISNELSYSLKSIQSLLQKKGLKSNKYIQITESVELQQLILGSILGDGHIGISTKNKSARLSIAHTTKQKEYIEFKYNIFKKYNLAPIKISNNFLRNKKLNKVYEEFRFKTLAHPLFLKYHTCFYNNNIKILNYDILKELDALGIAIWYMDDGFVTKDSFELSTLSFSETEVDFLRDLLYNKFNILTTKVLERRCNKYSIYILKESKNDFINLIEPYIIDSMKYKLVPYNERKIRVLYKLGELLEQPEEANQQPS